MRNQFPHPFSRRRAFTAALSTLGILLTSTPAAHAANDNWLGSVDSTWANVNNWATVSTVPGPGNTATFSESSIDTNGNTTIDLSSSGVTVGGLLFDSNAAAYIIGSGGAANQTLTLDTVGDAIKINSSVANNQLINANLALATTSTANNSATYYAVTNNSANTLTIAGGISASTAGVKTLNVTGTGNTTISGTITSGSGNVSLFKTGAGTLTLSGGATWSGTGITDGSNFSSSAVFRQGTTILSAGTYSNSNGEIVIGGVATQGDAGTDTTLQLDNSAILNNITWLSIGRGNGTGTATSNLTLNGSSSVSAVNMSAGFNAGSTLNLPKGTITLNGTSSLTISSFSNFAESAGSNMTMIVNGGTANFGGDLKVAMNAGSTGNITLTSGTINVGTTAEKWMRLNDGAGNGSANITINGGTLNLNTGSDIRFSPNASATGTNSFTLNGGTVQGQTGNANGVASINTIVDMNNAATGAVNNTFNLNGGTLLVGQVLSNQVNNAGGSRTFNFNGGTLKAAGSTAAFFNLGSGTGTATANVRNGGAIINTNGFNVTIAQALVHSTVGGDNAIDGGLTKLGTGTLTLTGTNTYTGNTTISAGTLTLGSSASSANFLADSSSLYLTTGAFLNLSFTSNSVMESITGLYIDGVQQLAGTWGAVGSGAANTSSLITGTGMLNVTASAIPEPATYAALLGALALGGAFIQRRSHVTRAQA